MNLIKDEKRSIGKLATKDGLPLFGDVPAQISYRRGHQALSERRLADLSRSGDENHLSVQILTYLRGEISLNHDINLLLFSSMIKNTREFFPPDRKYVQA